MSKEKQNKKETKKVEINENDLVELMNNIVEKAVASEKKQWIAENKSANDKVLKETVAKVAKLEKLLSSAKITKKVIKANPTK